MKNNSFINNYEFLLKEWDNDNRISPYNLSYGSNKIIKWICPNGKLAEHKWESPLYRRTIDGSGCPYCSHQKIHIDNCLETNNKYLSSQWDYEKNKPLTPRDVIYGGHTKYYWLCSCGTSWRASINNRKTRNCPECSKGSQTSFPEYVLLFYLAKHFKVLHQHKLKGINVDIYLPEIKTVIEYDGYYYHKDKINRDIEKNAILSDSGFKVIRLREFKLTNIPYSKNIISSSYNGLHKMVSELFKILHLKNSPIHIKKDLLEIQSLMRLKNKSQSIAKTHPQLLTYWDFEQNIISPEAISYGSNQQVQWVCSNHHKWINSPKEQLRYKNKCPKCRDNHIGITHPHLKEYWSVNNPPITEFSQGSNKVAEWVCPHCNDISHLSVRHKVKLKYLCKCQQKKP